MKDSRVNFGTFVCVFGQLFGYSIDYMKSTTNTCPCQAGPLSLIQCTAVCANDRSSDCKGVSFNLGNRTCCVCTTSIYGIPDQASDSRSVMYRPTFDSGCVKDLVNDIPDNHITASSSWKANHDTSRARLHTTQEGDLMGAWSAATNNPTEYIQVFPGNFDHYNSVWRRLPEPLLAVCIRIHPVTYHNHQSLRFGIFGCDL